MKRQMKIAAVVSATALLAIGASFTSMAALKNGTWVTDNGEWQYVNREGEYVESEWCYSHDGRKYWINEEGVLGANEWVTDGSHTYYVQSDGSMTVNAWKYLYAENEEEDADAEEAWFYFDAKGRMVENRYETIGGTKYYFGEDGKMLTGWINTAYKKSTASDATKYCVEVDGDKTVAASDLVYCYEDGSLAKNAWINVFPWTENSDDLYEGDDEVWYHTNSSGKLYRNTLQTFDNLKYIFDEDGKMLYNWVGKTVTITTDEDGKTTTTTEYENTENKFVANSFDAVYYCDADYGYVKVGGWKYLDDPTEEDTFWYHFDKTGKVFLGTGSDAAYNMVFEDGENHLVSTEKDDAGKEILYTVTMKKVGSTYYYFNQYGEMMDGFVKVAGDLMYLEDGARKTGKVTLTDELENDYTFYFGDESNTIKGYKKYVAVTGNVGGYLYNNGQLVTSTDSDNYSEKSLTNPVNNNTEIFVVNYLGKIQHKDNKEYANVANSKNYTYKSNTKGWDAYSVNTTDAE